MLTAVHQAINEALGMLPPSMDSPQARVMLWAIGLQESLLRHRRQLVGNPPTPTGPATGLWQFEQGGGCRGVLEHAAVRTLMRDVCVRRKVEPTPRALWTALQTDDVLAAAAARLLLFTDPQRLPAVDDEAGAWELYLRVWRPGAWARGNEQQRTALRAKWARYHADARHTVAAQRTGAA